MIYSSGTHFLERPVAVSSSLSRGCLPGWEFVESPRGEVGDELMDSERKGMDSKACGLNSSQRR